MRGSAQRGMRVVLGVRFGVMGERERQGAWTPEEVEREERAERARVQRDAARGVSRNLEDAVRHTAFARRFAEAFRHRRER